MEESKMNIKRLAVDWAKDVFQLYGVDETKHGILEKRITSREKFAEFVAKLGPCGGKDLKPTISGVKPDVETLIVLAEETFQLHNQIHQMQALINQMKQEPTHLPKLPGPARYESAITHEKKNAFVFFNPINSAEKKVIPQTNNVRCNIKSNL